MERGEAKVIAERIVDEWRFTKTQKWHHGQPLQLQHNEHWALVDALAEAIYSASQGTPPGLKTCKPVSVERTNS